MTKVTMPVPFLLVADQPWGGHAEVIKSARGQEGVIDCYTTSQMEAYAAAKVREALEAVIQNLEAESAIARGHKAYSAVLALMSQAELIRALIHQHDNE